jgi:hypothetical protein
MIEEISARRIDHALRVGTALSNDAIHRAGFARSLLTSLEAVSSKNGLVISIEGIWGSGKTSVLAMLEELAQAKPADRRPVIVHFNPWLVGDREALLRQFLGSISKEVRLADHAKEGKRVAKELKTYSKAFDVLKLIPGAEPWASMVKGVFESVGDAVDGVAEHKSLDLEERKNALEKALKKYPRRIIVLIDDVDRLFPAEVFEMVRIVKAVGDLPNIGYVLAWDPAYVSASLHELKVPFAETYLDKVVHLRLPIPPLSFSTRLRLMDEFHNSLDEEARVTYFPNNDERLSELFYSGLSEIMETPRDIVRLYDTVRHAEIGLRGELHIADIVGLSCLMTKAPNVYQLLQRTPQAFVGGNSSVVSFNEDLDEVAVGYENEVNTAIQRTGSPRAVRALISYLFPLVANSSSRHRSNPEFDAGRLSNPKRLHIALQLTLHPGDLSLLKVRYFINLPQKRSRIIDELNQENCVDFLDNLSQLLRNDGANSVTDVIELAVAIAGLIDSPSFLQHARNRRSAMQRRASINAVGAIDNLAQVSNVGRAREIALRLMTLPTNLSVAADLLLFNFAEMNSRSDWKLKVLDGDRQDVLLAYAENVINALSSGLLYKQSSSEIILWALVRLIPERCSEAFQSALSYDSTADLFIETHLRTGFDSIKGQIYSLPENPAHISAFEDITELKRRASSRLEDANLPNSVRAAWMAVLHDERYYGVDFSLVER